MFDKHKFKIVEQEVTTKIYHLVLANTNKEALAKFKKGDDYYPVGEDEYEYGTPNVVALTAKDKDEFRYIQAAGWLIDDLKEPTAPEPKKKRGRPKKS